MKVRAVIAGLAAMIGIAASAEVYNKVTYSKGAVVPGEWNADYKKCKAYQEANGNPIIVFWGNSGCSHCEKSENSIGTDAELAAWLKENEIVLSFSIGGNGNFPSASASAAKKFAGPTGSYPFVCYYWKDESGKEHVMRTKGDTTGAKMLAAAKSTFAGWSPCLKEAGNFPASSEYNRLEAEPGTETVDFTMTRDSAHAAATNLTIQAVAKGKVISSKSLVWTKGQTSQAVSVDVSKASGLKDGDDITLQVVDAKGGTKALAKTTVTWVDKPNSASNPLWIGEEVNFGEWTMDLDAAKALVAKTEGAFTLVSIQGSQWCPDCANTDRNFLDLESNGVNLFKAWAVENKVALVTIDIPNFSDEAGNFSSPTLLSRKAYESTLARNYYVDKNGNKVTTFKERDIGKTVFPSETPELTGADPALTQAVPRSGLGYLTRKGVSDADAKKVLDRNHELVTKNTAAGGFHRPEDTNKKRTGVPIFVLLRQDGTVAGRFTKFAAVSPFKADRANFTAYVTRIEELMNAAIDDGEIENNDATSTKKTLDAADGLLAGSLSHADNLDYYRLDGVQAGALQTVSLAPVGPATGEVTLEILKGTEVVATTNAALAEGIDVEVKVDDAGADYFVAAKVDRDAEAFAAASAKTTFRAYAMMAATVLVPETTNKTFNASGDTVSIRVETGKIYKISGIDGAVPGKLVWLKSGYFYQAYVTEDVAVKVAGGPIDYQRWETGSVGFDGSGMAVSETAGTVEIPVVRKDGTSGNVSVEVKLDLDRSVCTDKDGNPGYDVASYSDKTFAWNEGEEKAFRLPITLKSGVDYGEMDGMYVFTLKVVDGMAEISSSEYVLTVSKSVTPGPGKVAFADDAKVFAKVSEGAVLTVERRNGSDGAVSAKLKTTLGSLETTEVAWASHELTTHEVELAGVAVGKTAKVSFSGFTGGLAADKTGKTVSVTMVADDAPEFLASEFAWPAYRNVKFSKSCPVIGMASAANKLTAKKISGSLPKGLSIAWTGDAKFEVSGVPTKAGDYEAVYQVIETRGKTKVNGLTAKIVISVIDPAATDPAHPELMPLNNSCLVKRDFTDVMIVSKCDHRLLGTLTFQIPKGSTGKVSGKYKCAAGTVTFKAPKSWSALDGDNSLISEMDGNISGYKLTVKALANGEVDVNLVDPTHSDCDLGATIASAPWSAADSAEAWQGYYTVALVDGAVEGFTGCGFMTLKMSSASDWKKGSMAWTLKLPNGKSFSGKSVLTRGDETYAYLPVFVSKGEDTFSGVLRILSNAKAHKDEWRASVLSPDESDENFCLAYWTNTSAHSDVGYSIYGSIYDTAEDLDACCAEYYEKTDLNFCVDGDALASVKVGKDTIKLSNEIENTQKVTVKFTRSTGVLSGTFIVPGTKSTKASWSGVVIIGWGEGCGCSDAKVPVFLPFVNGAYTVGGKAAGNVAIDRPSK